MKFLIPLLLAVLLPALSHAETASKETAAKAIAIFCADPLSQEAKEAASVVLDFAEKSPEVEIDINPKAVPWTTEEPQTQHASLLLAAYIVGNTKAQLERGKAKNDPLAGVLQAIATYRILQKQEPDLKMPDLEKFIDLNTKNKLKDYLEAP